jgi:hypothetical protein
MRAFLPLGLALLALFSANTAHAQSSSLRPTLLRCEDCENPVGVDLLQLVSFGLGDWYDNLSEGEPTLTPVGLTDTVFYCLDYQVMAKNRQRAGQKGGCRAILEQSRRGSGGVQQKILQ